MDYTNDEYPKGVFLVEDCTNEYSHSAAAAVIEKVKDETIKENNTMILGGPGPACLKVKGVGAKEGAETVGVRIFCFGGVTVVSSKLPSTTLSTRIDPPLFFLPSLPSLPVL